MKKPLPLFFALLLSGCLGDLREDPLIQVLQRRLTAAEAQIKRLEVDHATSEGLFTELIRRTQCQPAVQQALKEIAERCSIGSPCKYDSVISNYLLHADPYRQGYILSVFMSSNHKAFYFNRQGQIIGDLDQHRKELQTAVFPPYFPNTRFLVISHPDPEEKRAGGDEKDGASRRGNVIINLMKELAFPDYPRQRIIETSEAKTNKVLHWVMPFLRPGEKIPKVDQIVGGKLTRSVWVFRVEC